MNVIPFPNLYFFCFQLTSKIRQKPSERIHCSQQSDEEEENEEDKLPFTSPALSTASGDTDMPSAVKKKKTNREESTAFFQRLKERIQQSNQIQESCLIKSTDPKVAERCQWAQWCLTTLYGPNSRQNPYNW